MSRGINRLALGCRWGRMLAAIDGAMGLLATVDASMLDDDALTELHSAVRKLGGVSQRAWSEYERERTNLNPRRPARPRKAGGK